MPAGQRARTPAKRTQAQWEALSDAQRLRYVRAGRTGTLNGRKGQTEAQVKRYYLSGKSLTAARRGRKSKEVTAQRARASTSVKPPGKDEVMQAQQGTIDDATKQLLQDWRKSKLYPSWLPQSQAIMGDDVAAILASIGSPPERWESVRFIFESDGSVTMVVQRKGRNQYGKPKPIVVRLPDRDAAAETGKLLSASNYPGMKVTTEGYASPGKQGQVAA